MSAAVHQLGCLFGCESHAIGLVICQPLEVMLGRRIVPSPQEKGQPQQNCFIEHYKCVDRRVDPPNPVFEPQAPRS
jgi:hypothetical protein